MIKYKILSLAVVACLLLGAAGFNGNDKELKKTQDELAKTKAALAATEKERDALKAELAQVKTGTPNAQLLQQRDDALNMAAEYQANWTNALAQLQDQTEKNLILQQQVSDMQTKIPYLLHRLDGATVMPSPTLDNCYTMPSPTYSGF